MSSEPTIVPVECYSGFTYAQRPVAFVWRERRYRIEQILSQGRSPKGRIFRVRTTEGETFQLTYDEARDTWSLQGSPTMADSAPAAEQPSAPNQERLLQRPGGKGYRNDA
jgi:hypothetical protein